MTGLKGCAHLCSLRRPGVVLPASLFVSVLYAVQSIRMLDNNAAIKLTLLDNNAAIKLTLLDNNVAIKLFLLDNNAATKRIFLISSAFYAPDRRMLIAYGIIVSNHCRNSYQSY